MKKNILLIFLGIFFYCDSHLKNPPAFFPTSSGKINYITIVMPESDWKSSLGQIVREEMSIVYEGLPLDEPQYSLIFMNPKAFNGFARQSRNVIWFQRDSITRFQLAKDQFAKPQIVASITGQDSDIQAFSFKENTDLLRRTIEESERREKLRRINKSPSTEINLEKRFGIHLSYPTAYKTLKDTVNFIWIQKPITKGHLNIISYTLPENALSGVFNERILNIRDSIGKLYLPGRLPGSYQITERAFLPYFYKTSLDGKQGFLTKGTWEVANDFMAGPFVNYMVKDSINERLIVVEGFAFAPSVSKREHMFELNTILSTMKQVN